MNVYVETNFVLEQALEQEQCESCQELIQLASAGSIHLVVPAFSLAEPQITLMHKGNERSRLASELQKHLSELGRSKGYRAIPGAFSELLALLIASGDRERMGLQGAIDGLLKTAQIIPLDSEVFSRAGGIQVALGMSPQDSIVLASIISHLAETKPAQSCFLNRNTRDFDDPKVREVLDEFGCKFIGRFDDGRRHIEARIRTEDQ